MKKELIMYGENCGIIGTPVFKDSLKKQLCIGDLALVIGRTHFSYNFVVKDCIYGWGSSTTKKGFDRVIVYKIVNYTDIEKLDKKFFENNNIKIKKEYEEMTKEQIEKELGFKIKIIK